MIAGAVRRLNLLTFSFFVLTSTGIGLAQDDTGKIEFVEATGRKYAWVPANVEYVFDKVRPPVGSAFLVVEAKAKVVYDENGKVSADVYIESAKGNKRAPVFEIAQRDELYQSSSIYERDFAKAKQGRSMRFRYVFVVPEATAATTIVLGTERAKIEFPGAPVDFPPPGGGPMTAKVLSTKFVEKLPLFGTDLGKLFVDRATGSEMTIERRSEPRFDRYFAVDVLVQQTDPAERYLPDHYHFERKDFVAVYDDGIPYRAESAGTVAGQIDAEGKLAESGETFYFPVPPGATKGTVYLRRLPIAEIEVPK